MSICSRIGEKHEVKAGRTAAVGLTVLLLLTASVLGARSQDQPAAQPAPTQAQAPASAPAPEAASPAPQAETQGAAPLRVMVGKSLLINTTERLKRVSVTDDSVADAIVVTPTQILVHGRSAGEVSLVIWDELERSRSFDLRVDVDVTAAAEEEKNVFPDEQITVTPSRSAIVLSGHVSTEDVAKRAGQIAEAYSKNVVNVLTFGPVGAQKCCWKLNSPKSTGQRRPSLASTSSRPEQRIRSAQSPRANSGASVSSKSKTTLAGAIPRFRRIRPSVMC